MCAMESAAAPDRKRPRPDAANGFHTQVTEKLSRRGLLASLRTAASVQVTSKPCLKFFSTCGCPYGEGCHFSHYVPGGVSTIANAGIGLTSSVKAPTSNVRPNLIATHVASAPPLANMGGGANLGSFKSRLCKQFGTPEGCRFGDKCHFAHGEKELKATTNVQVEQPKDMGPNSFVAPMMFRGPPKGTVPNSFAAPMMILEKPKNVVPNGYGSPIIVGEPPKRIAQNAYTPAVMAGEPPKAIISNGNFPIPMIDNTSPLPVVPLPREPPPPGIVNASASIDKITIDAAMAGIIIGKGGMHAKEISRATGAKLMIREHESDPNLKHVELEGTFDQIRFANQMVRDLLINKDPQPPKNAGSNPHNFKTKLCQNHAQGTCTFGERCHFAHGDSELRKPSLPA